MDNLLIALLNIVSSVAVLVLVCLGLALVFGLMGVINLAHGEFLMIGAFSEYELVSHGIPFWLGLVPAGLVAGIVGMIAERIVIRHLYGRLLETMLATWGLSLVLVQLATILFGPSPLTITEPLGSIGIGEARIAEYRLVLVGVAAVTVLLVVGVLTRTRYGVMARAASQSPATARLVGIDSSRMNMLTFGLGTAVAGVAGGLLTPIAGASAQLGASYIAQAFLTVLVGGASPVTGTLSAAAILGATESGVAYAATEFIGEAALLVVAMVVIRMIPRGISSKWLSSL